MFPIRRFSTFIARILFTCVLLSTSLFIIFSLLQYFFRNDIDRFAPTENYLERTHEHKHEIHHFKRRESIDVKPETIESTSRSETSRSVQQNESSITEIIKIANRPVSVYVHIDLKGAAPKISYFEQVFPLLKKLGANGICMEYEDMFPFDGIVSSIKHKQAYTKDDIEKINKLAKDNHLEVMPLLQTYGHLEFLLKLKEFSDLREHPKYPQVISPCINKSYPILFAMIDQYLSLHPDIRSFHIGHDEVYYFLTNPACEEFKRLTGIQTQYGLFAHHLNIIVNYIRKKNPNLSLFIWHDVIQNLNIVMLQQYSLMNTVIPVLWSYREDISVEGFIVGSQSNVFGQFKSLWGASAFKGATNEIATTSDVSRYYENQVSWIRQLNSYIPTKWKNFDGIMLTGWSRYDHFLSLCELLPYSMPSLAFSLTAWQEPWKSLSKTDIYANRELQQHVRRQLQCTLAIHLNIQEHITKPTPKCKFPGSGVYESMIYIPFLWNQVDQAELFVNKFVTDLHVKYDYIHVKRGEECLEKLRPVIYSLKRFIESFKNAMNEVFPAQVAIEWLETYFMTRFRSVNQRYEFIQRAVDEQKSWLPRPIPNVEKLDIDQKNHTR